MRGERLDAIPAYSSMWFAWNAFWPETAVWSGEGIAEEPITAVDEEFRAPQPLQVTLGQNAPNPFNASTRIEFDLPVGSAAELTVYDVLGRHIRNLAGGARPAGRHLVFWDGRDNQGADVASGVYFYRLVTAATKTRLRPMTLLR